MSLLTEAFETGPPPTGWATFGSPMMFSSGGRTGNALQIMGSSGSGTTSPSFTKTATVTVTLWINIGSMSPMSDEWLLFLDDGGTHNATLKINGGAGTLELINANDVTAVYTSDPIPADSGWHEIELTVESANSGAYSLSIDGGTAVTGTDDFTTSGTPGTDSISLCGQAMPYAYDDLDVSAAGGGGAVVTKMSGQRGSTARIRNNFY